MRRKTPQGLVRTRNLMPTTLNLAETQDEQASEVLPEFVPPREHMNIADRKRINKARIKERRELARSLRRNMRSC